MKSDDAHRPSLPFGVYFHVPLCQAKCAYCDFISWPVESLGAGRRGRIVHALEREVGLAQSANRILRGRAIDTIYFGGGTPSLLHPNEVARLVRHVLKSFVPRGFAPSSWRKDETNSATDEPNSSADPVIEITLECNPVSAGAPRIEEYIKAGVNRISLGVQSFDPKVLSELDRPHSIQETRQAIQRIRSAGFLSWGIDLIFGAPDSSLEQWRVDLDEAISYEPPHISVYGLTLHEGTRLYERHARRQVQLPPEETQREMFLMARDALTSAGWHHYEISNYARPGHRSRHNSIYWNGGEYLGLGVGAHSFFGGTRCSNPETLDDYLSAVEGSRYPAVEEDAPSLRSRRAERIMLALRQCDGIDLHRLSRDLGCDFQVEYANEIERLVETGLLIVSSHDVGLTDEGILLSDSVFEEFF